MNHRIRELARLAKDYAHDNEDPDERTSWDFLFETKFAELIVRECQFAIVSRTDLPRHERKLYNDVLKEHFGVLE